MFIVQPDLGYVQPDYKYHAQPDFKKPDQVFI